MNDLQEAGNVTQRAIEEMYDKEIITLQDFRTETENQVPLHPNLWRSLYFHSSFFIFPINESVDQDQT